MSNKKTSKSSRKRFTKAPKTSSQKIGSKDFKEVMREIISHPAVKFVASGLATAILTRLATKLSEHYPEVADFLRENIDRFENEYGVFSYTNQKNTSGPTQ